MTENEVVAFEKPIIH